MEYDLFECDHCSFRTTNAIAAMTHEKVNHGHSCGKTDTIAYPVQDGNIKCKKERHEYLD